MSDLSESLLSVPGGACLRVSGEDAASFLQTQATADLADLPVGEARYTLFINVKGRIEADAWVHRRESSVFDLVTLAADGADRLLRRLEPFIIIEEVTLTGRPCCLQLLAGDDGPTDSADAAAEDLVWNPGWPSAPGARLIARSGAPSTTGVDGSGFEAWRLARGIPRVPEDTEGLTPQEAGLVDRAVSFTKGCYLGQEVMAKLRASGRVNRQLAPFRVAEPVQAVPGDSLLADGRAIGEVRSCIQTGTTTLGIAVVRSRILDADTAPTLGEDGPSVLLGES